MDSVIRNILDIDRKTATLATETKKSLEENEQNLQAQLESKESERKEEARKEADEKFQAVIAQAQQQVEEMKREHDRKSERMQQRYLDHRDALAQAVLDQLLED